MSERVIYEVAVPAEERYRTDDTPEAYRVVEFQFQDRTTCIVYGRYSSLRINPEWEANPSCRWLVRHLIGRLNELVELKEWADSYE